MANKKVEYESFDLNDAERNARIHAAVIEALRVLKKHCTPTEACAVLEILRVYMRDYEDVELRCFEMPTEKMQ